ncbi:DNA internalization-related competence protein ComEC/Rec2 [Rosistilla oblonga]|uniref:ComEC family competence protein n=1 Tax=Rosistilla oblonga TaxID=2527990 RepID=A0A518IXK2_9BACT|nr:DNA internalization-related competence protein ComEC/Rec2 [Rosistilla oblonga]QDV57819.1 ComEC family competence protein [Rosistilla oblonga]
MSSQHSPGCPARLGRETRLLNAPRQPMLMIAVAGLIGILADHRLGISSDHWPLLVAVAIAVLTIAWVCQPLRIAAILLATAGSFGFYHHQQLYQYERQTLAGFLSDAWQPIWVEAIIRSPIQRRPDVLAEQRSEHPAEAWQSPMRIEVVAVRDGASYRAASGTARVIVDGEVTGLLYGDRIRFAGHAQRIPAASNPGEVDLQQAYRARRQLVRMHVDSPAQIDVVAAGNWSLRRAIDAIGNRGQLALTANLKPQQAPLAEALVLGRREAVDRSMRDRLLETGTIHLLAVSGLHVGIVAIAASWLAIFLGGSRTTNLMFVIGVCLAYMLVTGARPPVVRAATLISIFLIGRLIGKRSDPLNALASAAVLLMLIDPLSIGQIGTHLSFLAVATIVLCSGLPDPRPQLDPLDELLQSRWAMLLALGQTAWQSVRQLISISFWIWIIGLPIVWHHFHVITPISVIANVLLWIPLTVALVSGLVTAVLGGIWLPLGEVPGEICSRSLQMIVRLVDGLANIDGAFFWLPSPPHWMLPVFYLAIVATAFLIPHRYKRPAVLACAALWFAVAIGLATRRADPDRMIATFIDVGHGTSVLLEFPNGENWLYDAGRLGDPAFARWPIEAVLWSEGIRHLDGLIVSHADSDHYNAIAGLAERFSIARVVGSHELFEDKQQGIAEVGRVLKAKGIPIESLAAGDLLLQQPHCRVTALHPPAKHLPGKDNANSIVLRIDCFDRTIVLPGDLEQPGTAMLLIQARPRPGGVLMAPHHGSLSQDIFPILQWADPSVVIASGGKRAAGPRVRKMLTETGAQGFVTHRDGAIRVSIARDGIVVRTWRQSPWPKGG